MKKLLLLLLAFPSVAFGDTKISALTSTTSMNTSDIIPVVVNPGTSPANRIITFQNFYNSIPSTVTAASIGALTTSSATATYLNQTVAGSTYLTQSSATATYLQQSSATVSYCHADGTNCTATSGGGGSGTVNLGTTYQTPYYSVTGSSNALSATSNIQVFPASVTILNAVPLVSTGTLQSGAALYVASGTIAGQLHLVNSASTGHIFLKNPNAGSNSTLLRFYDGPTLTPVGNFGYTSAGGYFTFSDSNSVSAAQLGIGLGNKGGWNFLGPAISTFTYGVVAGTATVTSLTASQLVRTDANKMLVSSATLTTTELVGNLPVTQLNSGTNATSSTFWRGDGTWVSSATFGSGGGSGSVSNSTLTFVNIADSNNSIWALSVSTSGNLVTVTTTSASGVGFNGITVSTLTASSATITNLTVTGTCMNCGTGSGGGGYAVEPATVTFNLAKGLTASTATITGSAGASVTYGLSVGSATVNDLTASQIVVTDANKKLSSQAVLYSTRSFVFDATSLQPLETSFAPIESTSTVSTIYLTRAFDDTTREYANGKFKVPENIDTAGLITMRVDGRAKTAAGSKNVGFILEHLPLTNTESLNTSYLVSMSSGIAISATQATLDQLTWQMSVSSSTWAANDEVFFKLSRDPGAASDLTGDYYLLNFAIDIPVTAKP